MPPPERHAGRAQRPRRRCGGGPRLLRGEVRLLPLARAGDLQGIATRVAGSEVAAESLGLGRQHRRRGGRGAAARGAGAECAEPARGHRRRHPGVGRKSRRPARCGSTTSSSSLTLADGTIRSFTRQRRAPARRRAAIRSSPTARCCGLHRQGHARRHGVPRDPEIDHAAKSTTAASSHPALCRSSLGGQGKGVDPADLLKPLADSWPTYSGDYTGKRYSSLTQVNRLTVKNLTLAWTIGLTGRDPAPAAAAAAAAAT